MSLLRVVAFLSGVWAVTGLIPRATDQFSKDVDHQHQHRNRHHHHHQEQQRSVDEFQSCTLHPSRCSRRRQIVLDGSRTTFSLVIGSFVLGSSSSSSDAFENKISTKYDDRPKRRGPQPKDLGIGVRTTLEGDEIRGLKTCGAAPNCFSSTITMEDDPDHSIPAWIWPKDLGDDQVKAFDELKDVIKSYPPGQNGVDGGGFEIKTFDANKGYIYVQFEALKNGYIDDVEFAVVDGTGDRTIQVRSSSRIGYLDFGVNAKRLNWLANTLRMKGWEAEGVDSKKHQGYFAENNV